MASPASLMLLTASAHHANDTGGSKPVHVSPRVVAAGLSDKLLPLLEKMNAALEQYLQPGPLGISTTKSWT